MSDRGELKWCYQVTTGGTTCLLKNIIHQNANPLLLSWFGTGLRHGTCIDWVISNSKFVKYSKVTTKVLSDHLAVECVRKKTRDRSKYVYISLRDYKNYNKEILVDLLLNRLSIDDFVDLDDPNVMWDQLYNYVYGILSVMCPFRKYRQQQKSYIMD